MIRKVADARDAPKRDKTPRGKKPAENSGSEPFPNFQRLKGIDRLWKRNFPERILSSFSVGP